MPRHATITVYPKKYAHGFVVLCFVVVMQSFIMNSHEVFIHIHQGCFAGTGSIVRLSQCQWSKPDGYGKISQCITTTKHSKAKTVCIFLGIYCKTRSAERLGEFWSVIVNFMMNNVPADGLASRVVGYLRVQWSLDSSPASIGDGLRFKTPIYFSDLYTGYRFQLRLGKAKVITLVSA